MDAPQPLCKLFSLEELEALINNLALKWKSEESIDIRRKYATAILRLSARNLSTTVHHALKRNPQAETLHKDIVEETSQHAYIFTIYGMLKSYNPVSNTAGFYQYCRQGLIDEIESYLDKRVKGLPYQTYPKSFDCSEIIYPEGVLSGRRDTLFMQMLYNDCSDLASKSLSGLVKGITLSEIARLANHKRKIIDNAIQECKKKGSKILHDNAALFEIYKQGDSTP